MPRHCFMVISPLTCDAEHIFFISLYLQHFLTLVFWVKYSFREMSWPKHLSASLPILTTHSHSCLHLLSVIIGPFRVGIDHNETILKTTQQKYQLTSRCPIILTEHLLNDNKVSWWSWTTWFESWRHHFRVNDHRRLLNLSEPQEAHIQNGGNYST